MRKPKARNVLAAIIVVAALLGVGLVVAQDQETLRVRAPLGAADERFPEYLSRLLGTPLTSGDRYIVHTNGRTAFPAMLEAIRGARHRISLETYIYSDGRVAAMFTDAIEAAARRGVKVQLVLDAIGSDMDPEHVRRLEAAGCRIGTFNAVGSYSFEELNYRTHRKALVVDGETAFVGGMGIADQWMFDTEKHKAWRDTHVEVRGPAALNIEAGFHENWIETGGVVEPDLLRHDDRHKGSARSIVVWSSPEGGTNRLKLLYMLAIGAARRTLDIQSPYLITDESTQWSLEEARKRGVRIRFLVEGDVTDAKAVKFASRADYEWLMERGMEIYEYKPTMMHTKAFVVDGILSIVGSANFDNRSLELNDELNVAIFDRELAARLLADFDADAKDSARLDLASWRARPAHIRARELLWSYFGEVF